MKENTNADLKDFFNIYIKEDSLIKIMRINKFDIGSISKEKRNGADCIVFSLINEKFHRLTFYNDTIISIEYRNEIYDINCDSTQFIYNLLFGTKFI